MDAIETQRNRRMRNIILASFLLDGLCGAAALNVHPAFLVGVVCASFFAGWRLRVLNSESVNHVALMNAALTN